MTEDQIKRDAVRFLDIRSNCHKLDIDVMDFMMFLQIQAIDHQTDVIERKMKSQNQLLDWMLNEMSKRQELWDYAK